MNPDSSFALGLQQLADSRHGQLLQTHISWVLLVDDVAYKIKKPVNFGFLDFSDLAKRRHACEEELRLNRRLAPDWYLAVVPIGGTAAQPQLEAPGTPLEYAVKMRRFPAGSLLAQLLQHQQVTAAMIERLADTIAAFHAGLPPAGNVEDWGRPDSIIAPVRQNFAQLAPFEAQIGLPGILSTLSQWSENHAERLRPAFTARRCNGHIRECHGDLHAGNIAWANAAPLIFDAIEFNPDLRWGDTISEIAFTVMDLQARQQPELARLLLNRYLEQSGDYAGLPLLDFYLVYRAVVRAKIAAFEANWPACREYLQLAQSFTRPPPPRLFITHGLSGSGKSTVSAHMALTQPRLIRIRSDVERKRLFGLAPLQPSRSHGNIYTPQATRQTYRQIMNGARNCLAGGYSCIVDAAFLKRNERHRFAELAQAWNVPYGIVHCEASRATLLARLQTRQQSGNDASEADAAILKKQLEWSEALTPAELQAVVPAVS